MRARRPVGAGSLLVLVLGTLALSCGQARAGDVLFVPNLTVSEEYNDNILETAGNRRADWVSRARPGVTWKYRAPSLNSDLAYTFDYRNFARRTKEDEMVHSLAYTGSAAFTDNWFFIDVSDQLSRVSLSVARDVTKESLFVNQTDQNVALVNPYLVWHPGAKSTVKTGYGFSDTRYWGSSGISKRQHRGSADYSQELGERVTLSASYSFSTVDTDTVDYREHSVSGGLRYEYAEKCFLFGTVGNSWQSFIGLRDASNLLYLAGLTHSIGTLSATLQSQIQYAEDPLAVSTRQTSHSLRLENLGEPAGYGLSASYNTYKGALSALADRTSISVQAFWRCQFTERFSATLNALGDRVKGGGNDGYPYHASGSLGVAYRFNYDISTALSYGYLEYRRRWDSATDARQGNRVTLELAKAF
jgi:hypothetical protein